jgi:hypothetical protein
MTKLTIDIDELVARRVADTAADRGVAPEEVAAQAVTKRFAPPRRHLAFAAIGSSSSGRGAAEADEMLVEGFGRD